MGLLVRDRQVLGLSRKRVCPGCREIRPLEKAADKRHTLGVGRFCQGS